MATTAIHLGRWVVNLGREPRGAGRPPRLVMCGLTRAGWYWTAHRIAWRLYRVDLWRPPHSAFPARFDGRSSDGRSRS